MKCLKLPRTRVFFITLEVVNYTVLRLYKNKNKKRRDYNENVLDENTNTEKKAAEKLVTANILVHI
jgi:hypothetical protein